MPLNPVTTATIFGLSTESGENVAVSINADGEVITAGGGGALSVLQYEVETTKVSGAGAAFADIDLLPTMKLSPDLTAGQLAQPDADYKLTRVVIATSTPGQTLELSRTAALGVGGDKTTLSTAAGVTIQTMRYSASTAQRTVAVASPGTAVTYQVQVSFAVGVA